MGAPRTALADLHLDREAEALSKPQVGTTDFASSGMRPDGFALSSMSAVSLAGGLHTAASETPICRP
jgi:hypothetical protein